MKRAIMLIEFILPFVTKAQVEKFDAYPVYTSNDLGLIYTPQQSSFRIWTPTAEKAELILYNEGTGRTVLQTISMQKSKSETWIASLKG